MCSLGVIYNPNPESCWGGGVFLKEPQFPDSSTTVNKIAIS